jgi:hypothetical protein
MTSITGIMPLSQELVVATMLAFVGYVIYEMYIKTVETPIHTKHKIGFMNPSYFAFRSQLRGLKWSLPATVRNSLGKGEVYINNFAYSDEVKNFRPKFTKRATKTKAFLEIKKLAYQLLVFGEMGTGKTEFFWNLLFELRRYRKIIYDTKGDYRNVLVNNKRGWSANFYDKNGRVWNIFAEANFYDIADFFSKNIITAAVGNSDGSNFFANSAAERIKAILEKAYLRQKEEKRDPWKLFLEEITNYEEAAKTQKRGEAKENQDVYNNVILVLEFLKFWAWRAKQIDTRFFTISDFFKSRDTMVLHSNNRKIQSFYAGLLSVIIFEQSKQLDLKDRPENEQDDYTVYLLDEFLQVGLDTEARTKLHTFLRSKGGIPIIGTQKLPDNQKEADELVNSSYGIILFQISDEKTRKYLEGAFDNVEYHEFQKQGREYRRELRTKPFISAQGILEIPKFRHLCLLKRAEKKAGGNLIDSFFSEFMKSDDLSGSGNGIYYLGYTQTIDKQDFCVLKPKPFSPINEDEFKKELHKINEKGGENEK